MSSLLVAAIDFGTTYSGWAFSFKNDFVQEPTKISTKNWTGGQLVSQKGPTCVLIHPDGNTLHSFGYEAENEYSELALENHHEQWFFFQHFKMSLFGRIGIEQNLMIEDASGKKKLKAKTVFALSIKYIKDDLITTMEKRITGDEIRDSDIHWVITVPAIWNDAAKQFMREAAEEAGIATDRLTLALEPEVASLFCRHLPVEKRQGRDNVSLAKFQAGRKYLVLDAGGGTVDITIHEVLINGNLKELHKASGGAWGGTKVNDAFKDFLSEIIGPECIENLKEERMFNYIDLFRGFEIKKRGITSKTAKIAINIPLADIQEKKGVGYVKECIAKSRYREKLVLIGDKIKMDADVMKGFFDIPLRSILDHVKTLLAEPQVTGCSAIVMVGGLSDSPLLQEHIEKHFPDMKIIIPDEAGLAVLKGAVIFGHNPTTIAERVCKFTYGEACSHLTTDFCTHPKLNTKIDENGEMRCYDNFRIHVKIGQSVKLGEEQEELISSPVYDTQTAIGKEIYVSSNPNPVFVTDPDCSKIGSFRVPIPDTSLGRSRKFGTTFLFGGTEIEVKVVDKATDQVIKKICRFS